MFKIRGSALIILSEVAKKHSRDIYDNFISQVYLKYSTSTLSSNKWYEFFKEDKMDFLADLAAQMFPGDAMALRKLGSLQVREATTKYHYFFLRVASPKIVFARAIKVWETFYDTGEFELELVNQKTAILHIRKFPEMPQHLRETISGNFEGLGILMNRPTTIVHDDSKPDDFLWKIEWK